MKYEIINPSDECYIVAYDENIACVSVLLLGMGCYGLKDTDGNTVLPIFILGGADEWIDEHIGNLEEFMLKNKSAIADCLRTVYYPEERTSLNDIQGRALKLAEDLSGGQ